MRIAIIFIYRYFSLLSCGGVRGGGGFLAAGGTHPHPFKLTLKLPLLYVPRYAPCAIRYALYYMLGVARSEPCAIRRTLYGIRCTFTLYALGYTLHVLCHTLYACVIRYTRYIFPLRRWATAHSVHYVVCNA